MGVDSDVGVDSGANMGTDDSVARLLASYPWLDRPGASFVTLRENGRLRGCIGSLAAYRPLGEDVAAHAVDAAIRDPRFRPVSAAEYPLLDVEISVLGEPEPITISSAQAGDMQDVRARDARDMQDARARDARDARAARDVRDTQNAGTQSARADESRADDVRPVRSRAELESALQPGRDGLILDNGRGSRATFLPQVWDELPDAHDFVSHLLAKAGLPASYDWNDGQIDCQRYTVMAYGEQ
jgi:AMMECR1 domain-containing protein